MRTCLLAIVLLMMTVPTLLPQEINTFWVSRFNGTGNNLDEVRDIAIDGLGNIYVAGVSFRNPAYPWNQDFLTIKYLPNGDTAWVRLYNEIGSEADAAVSVGVDDFGNVYVAGNSSYGSDRDFATIKYETDGDTAWVRRCRLTGSSSDEVHGMAVDGLGNAYVTGTTIDITTNSTDILTVKYYANGDTAWVRSFDGEGQSSDKPVAVAVDHDGSVFVTGVSINSSAVLVCATIKYDSFGNELWVGEYAGLSNGIETLALCVDSTGSAYVCGYYWDGAGKTDMFTIRHTINGDTSWVRTYNGLGETNDEAHDIAVDDNGSVYVTGWSYGSGYLTIKYDLDGDTAWVRSYNDWGAYRASSLSLDASGSVYVTGYGFKCKPGISDIITLKYSPEGEVLWRRMYDGPGGDQDYAAKLVTNEVGDVLVTGRSFGNGTYYDYVTIKYSLDLPSYPCGDADSSGEVDIDDVVYLIQYIFSGGPEPSAFQLGNPDCCFGIDIDDVVYLINYIFAGGPFPCDPDGDEVPDC